MPRAPGRSEQSTREESGANAADGSRRSGTPAGDKPRPPHRIYPRTETAIGTGYRSGKSVRVRGSRVSAKSTATNGTVVKRRNRKGRRRESRDPRSGLLPLLPPRIRALSDIAVGRGCCGDDGGWRQNSLAGGRAR